MNYYFVLRSDDRAKNKPNDNLYQYGYIDMDTETNDQFNEKIPDREEYFIRCFDLYNW